MRERKFQAWDPGNERMYIGGFSISPYGEILDIGWHTKEINDIILREYTGLKDIHDKEIYEGDILYNPYDRDGRHTVTWGEAGWCLGDDDSYLPRYMPQEHWEIVGNIYERYKGDK